MVEISQAGTSATTSTANELIVTVSYKERYKRPKHCKRLDPVQVGTSYSIGEMEMAGNVLYVPVIATITAVYLLCNGESTGKTFTETFTLSFQGQSTLTSGVSVVSYGKTYDAVASCCGTTTLLVNDSIAVTVS